MVLGSGRQDSGSGGSGGTDGCGSGGGGGSDGSGNHGTPFVWPAAVRQREALAVKMVLSSGRQDSSSGGGGGSSNDGRSDGAGGGSDGSGGSGNHGIAFVWSAGVKLPDALAVRMALSFASRDSSSASVLPYSLR